MTAMLKLEEAIAPWSASGSKDGGERSGSIHLIERRAGRPMPQLEFERVKMRIAEELRRIRSPADKWSMIKAQQLPLQREPIKTRSRRASTVKVERSGASNTFTARSKRYNRKLGSS